MGDGGTEPNPWTLYTDVSTDLSGTSDEIPNLRIALRYRYYDTQSHTDAQWDEGEIQDFYETALSCVSSGATYPW